ncbi:MAG: TonB-dependent receptor [Rikenellaceae bacterium]
MDLYLLFKSRVRQLRVTSLILFAILSLVIPSTLMAAPITISGKIVDSSGEALTGAAVVIKDSTVGTITDLDGNFTITATPESVLIISYIGYQTVEVSVGVRTEINITLKQDAIAVNDVVVVAFGTQNKANITGSISSVSGELLESRPVTNVSNALQGVVPGLNFSVNDSGGQLNNALSVNIRGAGTVGDGSSASPLILIDGVEGDMNMLNPDDIESISVLKDAAASSIYGSKAPFGVILITTKGGKEGKTRVTYSNDFRLSTPISVPDQMNSIRFAYMYNDAFLNSGQSAKISDETIALMVQFQNGEIPYGTSVNPETGAWLGSLGSYGNTDWYDVYYKDTSFSQTHSINLSGGSERVNYYFSGRYLDQGGLIRYGDDNLKRYNFSGKVSAKLASNIDMTYNVNYTRQVYDAPTYLNYYFYHQIQRTWPSLSVYDPNGFFTDDSDIYRLVDGGRSTDTNESVVQQLQFKYTPIENWNINLDATLKSNNNQSKDVYLPVYEYNAAGEPTAVALNNTINAGESRIAETVATPRTYTINAFSDYSLTLGDNHNINALVGFNGYLYHYKYMMAQADALISTSVPALGAATGTTEINYSESQSATAGFFSRVNYDYKGVYLLEANLRYDGSSRFTRENRWNLFPSVSVGYNIAATDYWQSFSQAFNILKFRASWGSLGNENTFGYYPFYQTQPYTSNGGYWILNNGLTSSADIPSLVSSTLTWETIETINFGFDFSLWSNRLSGKIDLFSRMTKNMIGPAESLPGVLGINPPSTNNADLESKGYEIELSWRDMVGSDFKYGVSLTFADDIQTVVSYPNADGSINTWGGGSGWYDGKRYGEIWGYETIGIAKSDAEMNAHLEAVGGQSALGDSWAAGDIMYADQDGVEGINTGANSVNDHGDLIVIGNTTPRYKYGITVDCAWKGFDFNMFWQGVGKRDYMCGYNGSASSIQQIAGFWGVVSSNAQTVGFEQHFDYFREEGHPLGANTDSYYPRPYATSDKNHWYQSGYVIDASYIRLKNMQIGYTIPSHITESWKINRLRVYFSADNLLTFTNCPAMFDPETLGGTWGTGKTYPLSATYAMGLNLNF